MLKKMGVSLLTAFTMLVSTFNVGIGTRAYAIAPCTTPEECRELQREMRGNIANIIDEEEEVSENIAELQVEISDSRDMIAELEEAIGDLESEIADLEGEITDLGGEVTDLEGEITDLEGEITDLEEEIADLEGEIADLEGEILTLEGEIADLEGETSILEGEITENIAILEDTEDHIEVLVYEISWRMRINQRVINTNSFLVILSEAENLIDFIRRARTFNRFAAEDAELRDELNELVKFQENLLLDLEDQLGQLEKQKDQLREQVYQLQQRSEQLEEQTEQLEEQTEQLKEQTEQLQQRSEQLKEQTEQLQQRSEQLEALKVELEVEQENLEENQVVLIERETEMQDMLYQLNTERMTQEEMAAAVNEAEEILARTPPPPVITPTSPPSTTSPPTSPPQTNPQPTTSLSATNSPTTPSPTTSPATNPLPMSSPSQTPSANHLAHPMPGARVTSEFGPRGGGHHSGVDLVVIGNQSAPILAAASGTITINQWHSSLGWYVVISHNINGQRVDTLYAHLRYQPSIAVGTVVSQGTRIGTKGSTGNSSGPHLHFEVHPGGWAWGNSVNPRNWVNL